MFRWTEEMSSGTYSEVWHVLTSVLTRQYEQLQFGHCREPILQPRKQQRINRSVQNLGKKSKTKWLSLLKPLTASHKQKCIFSRDTVPLSFTKLHKSQTNICTVRYSYKIYAVMHVHITVQICCAYKYSTWSSFTGKKNTFWVYKVLKVQMGTRSLF